MTMVTINGVPLSTVHAGAKAIAAGDEHSIVMKTDGTVWVAGYNGDGQLGDGTITDRNKFTKVVSSGQCYTKGLFTGVCAKP